MIKKAIILSLVLGNTVMAKDIDLINKFYEYDCKIYVERDELISDLGFQMKRSISKMKTYIYNQYFEYNAESNNIDINNYHRELAKNTINREVDTNVCQAIKDSLDNVIIKVNMTEWNEIIKR